MFQQLELEHWNEHFFRSSLPCLVHCLCLPQGFIHSRWGGRWLMWRSCGKSLCPNAVCMSKSQHRCMGQCAGAREQVRKCACQQNEGPSDKQGIDSIKDPSGISFVVLCSVFGYLLTRGPGLPVRPIGPAGPLSANCNRKRKSFSYLYIPLLETAKPAWPTPCAVTNGSSPTGTRNPAEWAKITSGRCRWDITKVNGLWPSVHKTNHVPSVCEEGQIHPWCNSIDFCEVRPGRKEPTTASYRYGVLTLPYMLRWSRTCTVSSTDVVYLYNFWRQCILPLLYVVPTLCRKDCLLCRDYKLAR